MGGFALITLIQVVIGIASIPRHSSKCTVTDRHPKLAYASPSCEASSGPAGYFPVLYRRLEEGLPDRLHIDGSCIWYVPLGISAEPDPDAPRRHGGVHFDHPSIPPNGLGNDQDGC